MKKNIILVYTGDGKGKTTAALGLVLRARGHNIKVGWVSFFKDHYSLNTGEAKMLKRIGVNLHCFAPRHPFCHNNEPIAVIEKECSKARDFIKEALRNNSYGLLVLDELNIVLRDKFLKTKELLDILRKRDFSTDIVITGRGAPPDLKKIADLVTVMRKVKHHYDSGALMRKGIEY